MSNWGKACPLFPDRIRQTGCSPHAGATVALGAGLEDKTALRCVGADDAVKGALEGRFRPCVDAVLRSLLPRVEP